MFSCSGQKVESLLMTLVEIFQTVEQHKARKFLIWLGAILAVSTILDGLIYDTFAGRVSPNPFLTLVMSLLAWLAYKNNFKRIDQLSIMLCFFNGFCLFLLVVLGASSGTDWLKFNDQEMLLYSITHLTIFRSATLSFHTTFFAVFMNFIAYGILTLLCERWVRNPAHSLSQTQTSEQDGNPTDLNKETAILDLEKTVGTDQAEEKDQSQSVKTQNIRLRQSTSKEDSSKATSDQIDGEKIQKELQKKYQKGRLAIQFRDDAKIGWQQIKELPVPYQLKYLKFLSDNPKGEVESLVHELLREHERKKAPFEDETLNKYFNELAKVSQNAAGEFKQVVDILGDTIDPGAAKSIIMNWHGKVGKRLIEYRESLKVCLKNRWLPDAHFRHLFSDEFDTFVEVKNIRQVEHKDAWCMFVEHLYEQCGWEVPRT